MQREQDKDRFTCEACGASFQSQEELDRHKGEKHPAAATG